MVRKNNYSGLVPYKDLGGNSGVLGYEAGSDFIRVKFYYSDVYTYTYAHTGKKHVEEMKRLAAKGKGLATYISRFVRDDYARRA